MTDNLKPCPFCGNEWGLVVKDDREGFYWVECDQCYGSTEGGYSEKSAIKNWNIREYEELLKTATSTLKDFVENDGYTSYISDDEKEEEYHIIEARKLIEKLEEFVNEIRKV